MTRRSAEVRLEALLRTACEVIAERGMANTRTADVARAAGVSQALVFYHFASRERMLAQAFTYAAERDLARVDAVVESPTAPLDKLRRLLRLHGPGGRTAPWGMWIDGWSESLRVPELERVSRRVDLRWRAALAGVIESGVHDGTLKCDDPQGAAWRILALIDGLAVQVSVHERTASRRQVGDWVRLAAARELSLEPEQLA